MVTPLGAFLSLEKLPDSAILDAWLFFLAMQVVGWLAPAELNVNVAHEPWPFLPWASGPVTFRVVNAVGALFFLLGAYAVGRRFIAPPVHSPST